ncbi:flagellar basal body-associated FliL family protein [Hoeflea prorocentri]|uniref:Flagellar protein FliL n=1 Tax=Hoeflea prorocentri TaxID=1922333 RepID=A0A9X3UKS1_9HYPH|nr:flagellar basal body-associated FliL family protein [Hoeflea prorocentri]MCY6382391.1 flagellar basal body-associated FliL family protein [Hoeflea prorocentri]MDA5400191.1 flagellar basal body-associated FliL family protein [Hoeflea prorocentri]
MTTPEEKKKGGSLVMTIVALLVLTGVAGGGGWLVGSMVGNQMATDIQAEADPVSPLEAMAAKENGDNGDGKDGEGAEAVPMTPQTLTLAPITTNLSYPSDSWVRVEVALVFDAAPDPALAETIHQDVMAYMRTVSLQQIEGPRGFQHLRDDLSERAAIRSDGQVSNVLFRTFLIE